MLNIRINRRTKTIIPKQPKTKAKAKSCAKVYRHHLYRQACVHLGLIFPFHQARLRSNLTLFFFFNQSKLEFGFNLTFIDSYLHCQNCKIRPVISEISEYIAEYTKMLVKWNVFNVSTYIHTLLMIGKDIRFFLLYY